jgi:hypothetical protein
MARRRSRDPRSRIHIAFVIPAERLLTLSLHFDALSRRLLPMHTCKGKDDLGKYL